MRIQPQILGFRRRIALIGGSMSLDIGFWSPVDQNDSRPQVVECSQNMRESEMGFETIVKIAQGNK